MIDMGIHNHPLKKFANKDQELVVILVGARGPKRNDLWRA
jgi:hypothetical protein